MSVHAVLAGCIAAHVHILLLGVCARATDVCDGVTDLTMYQAA